jgi:hypothetical protein
VLRRRTPNTALQRIAARWRMLLNLKGSVWAARAEGRRSPGREASGRTRQLSRELLPAATRRENKELKTDAPSGHGLAATLDDRNKCLSEGMT